MPSRENAGAAKAEENNDKKRPAHILLEALSRALEAGVDQAQLKVMVDMARMAKGVQQAPVWKMVAETLDGYTATAKVRNPGG